MSYDLRPLELRSLCVIVRVNISDTCEPLDPIHVHESLFQTEAAVDHVTPLRPNHRVYEQPIKGELKRTPSLQPPST